MEREPVLRLASLLCRLRRATSIETGLFQDHVEHLPANDQISQLTLSGDGVVSETTACPQACSQREITKCFLHLASTNGAALAGVSRYEAALWRQLRQMLFTRNYFLGSNARCPLLGPSMLGGDQ